MSSESSKRHAPPPPSLAPGLSHLHVLVAVVDGGSFAAAAKSLQVARATVRRNLAELEARTGTPLLVRRDGGLVPTEAGALVVRRARVMIAEAAALLDQAHTIGAEPSGLVRIAHPAGEPPLAVNALVRAVRARWPSLRIEFVLCRDPHRELLAHADIALTLERRLPQGPWEAIAIAEFVERLVASPAYLDRRGRPETPDDLHRHEVLCWRSPEGEAEDLPLLDGGTVRVEPAFISTNIHVLHELAVAGAGIAYVPDGELALVAAPEGALEVVLPDRVGGRRPLHVLIPKVLEQTPRTRAIAESIKLALARRAPRA